jgi:hypothetical protein
MGLLPRARGARSASEGTIAAEIAGEISGQVAVGTHIVQVAAQHGAIVNVAAPERLPTVRPRALPVRVTPRDFPDLLGREHELAEVRAAVRDGLAVDVHAAAGMGKTSLLRNLVHRAPELCEEGVVFLRAAGEQADDIAEALFEAFYEADAPFKPTLLELRRHLGERRALIAVDDLDCDRDEVTELLDTAGACRFLLASTRQCQWGEGRSLALRGLAPDAALALLERELGRELRAEERERAAEMCRRLAGRPLSIVQAAALARDAAPAPAPEDPEELERAVRARLDDDEQRVLGALELLAPAAVHVDDVAAIAGVPDAGAVLERLHSAGAAQAHSPRWSATLASAPSPVPPDRERAADAARQMTRGAAERPLADVPVVVAALSAAASAQRWDEVVALARAADPLLALGRRWGAWRLAAERMLDAARQASDRAGEAWALHQLGTRAGCLGDSAAARPALERALALRRELGDEHGAAVTAHNLAVLLGGGPGGIVDGDGTPQPRTPRPSLARTLLVGGLSLALGGAAGAVVASSGDDAAVQAGEPAAVTTITAPGKTVTTPITTIAGPAVTVTIASPSETVTVASPPETVTQTLTETVVTTVYVDRGTPLR